MHMSEYERYRAQNMERLVDSSQEAAEEVGISGHFTPSDTNLYTPFDSVVRIVTRDADTQTNYW